MTVQKTHWKLLHNPNYLGAYSLPVDPITERPQDMAVEILSINVEEIVGIGGKKDDKPVIRFKSVNKPMILNSTNMKSIEAILGTPYIEKWIGKVITIYADKTKYAGEFVDCLRIKKFVQQVQSPQVDAYMAFRAEQFEKFKNTAETKGTMALKDEYKSLVSPFKGKFWTECSEKLKSIAQQRDQFNAESTGVADVEPVTA